MIGDTGHWFAIEFYEDVRALLGGCFFSPALNRQRNRLVGDAAVVVVCILPLLRGWRSGWGFWALFSGGGRSLQFGASLGRVLRLCWWEYHCSTGILSTELGATALPAARSTTSWILLTKTWCSYKNWNLCFVKTIIQRKYWIEFLPVNLLIIVPSSKSCQMYIKDYGNKSCTGQAFQCAFTFLHSH